MYMEEHKDCIFFFFFFFFLKKSYAPSLTKRSLFFIYNKGHKQIQ